ANTGDDIVMHGLHVSPDPDILIYTLAGVVNPQTGWGFRDETFRVAEGLAGYGRAVWFQLGDRDLATHIHRTAMLKEGATLSEVIESIRSAHGVGTRILPMSDSPVPTMLQTGEGRMHLQEYFVRRRCEPRLEAIVFEGAERALAAPGVIDCLHASDAIVIAPSNPLISIGPILAVPGIRDALRENRARVIAVSPLVGGKSLKGPSDKMMREMGHEVSAAGVARLYRDICANFVIDETDAEQSPAIAALGMTPIVCPTVMRSTADKEQLARVVLRLGGARA
ncbi:MAG TPA: 2-phospho-L-lactate transferase, partial [Micropepsaceae bacterium]